MAKNSEELSLNKVKNIHGVEIKKMPCGKYFEALQALKNLPEDFIKELSDGNEDFKISEMITLEGMTELVTKLIIIAPKFVFEFLGKILDVKEKVLREELSPVELVEVCKVFWEVNRLDDFFAQMKSIMPKMKGLVGFNELSQSVLKSE